MRHIDVYEVAIELKLPHLFVFIIFYLSLDFNETLSGDTVLQVQQIKCFQSMNNHFLIIMMTILSKVIVMTFFYNPAAQEGLVEQYLPYRSVTIIQRFNPSIIKHPTF